MQSEEPVLVGPGVGRHPAGEMRIEIGTDSELISINGQLNPAVQKPVGSSLLPRSRLSGRWK